MVVALVVEPSPGGCADATVTWLDDVLAGLAASVDACADLRDVGEVSDADRIDRVGRLKRVKAAASALQAAKSVRFARSQVEQQCADEVEPRAIGRGIADQLALACHVSPSQGSRRLGVARALWFDLPQTYRLLTEGRISERVAGVVVSETRHLDAAARAHVDAAVVAGGLEELGLRSAAPLARAKAYAADPRGYTERGRTERRHRRVSLRSAPDTMALLTGYLPVEQGVACLAALKQRVAALKAGGDPRTRDQIMADTLLERVTGQTRADDVDIELQLMMSLDSLLDPDDPAPAVIPGHGPLPGPLAREIFASSAGRTWWRRLFTAQRARTADGSGPVVGGDPARRLFDGWLEKLIDLRDQTCREPCCAALVRHRDHVRPFRDGGATTLANGRAVCERGNYVREMPGWKLEVLDDGLHGRPHRVRVTTPSGHSYERRAADPPRLPELSSWAR